MNKGIQTSFGRGILSEEPKGVTGREFAEGAGGVVVVVKIILGEAFLTIVLEISDSSSSK